MITLNLIVTNVYNSVKAPARRGFSYIEIWMIGVQIPILVGILEYAILLALMKYHKGNKKSTLVKVSQWLMVKTTNESKSNWNIVERIVDKWTFVGALAFIMIFNIIYWVLTLM